MFHVYFTNHQYFSQREFSCLGDAIEWGKSQCFDFQVWGAARTKRFATWTVFGGLQLPLDGFAD